MGFDFLKNSKTVSSFELNSAQLKVFKVESNDFEHAKSEVILFDTPIIDDGRISDYKELKTALKYLIKKGFASGQNILSVPSSFVFTNIVSLPYYSLEELKAIIKQEIPRQIPFDADNACTDYAILHKDNSTNKAKVLISAIKRDFAKEIENVFVEAGVKLSQITVSSFNIINSLEFSDVEPSSLVINFDWQNTDMAIIQNNLPVFYHNILSGKENILKSTFQSKFNYEQASKIFDEIDLGSLNQEFEESVSNTKVSLTAKSIYTGILGEIDQILDFYYSQSEGDTRVNNVIITGEGTKIKGLVELVTQKLCMIANSSDTDNFNVCKGVFNQDNKLNINLICKKFSAPKLTENVSRDVVLKSKKIVTASCFALAFLMFIYLVLLFPLLKMKKDLKEANAECEKLKPQVEEIAIQAKELKYRQKVESMKIIAKSVIDSQIMNWKQILTDISSSVPADIRITEIDRVESRDSEGKQLNIKGTIDINKTGSLSPVSYFVLNINESLGSKSQLSDATIKSLQFDEQSNQYVFELQTLVNASTSEGLKNE